MLPFAATAIYPETQNEYCTLSVVTPDLTLMVICHRPGIMKYKVSIVYVPSELEVTLGHAVDVWPWSGM